MFENLISFGDEKQDLDSTTPQQFAIKRYLSEPEVESLDEQGRQTQEGTNTSTLQPRFISGEEESLTSLDANMFHQFIIGISAYKWLIASLISEAKHMRIGHDSMENIRQYIFDTLPLTPNPAMESKEASQSYCATFVLPWDPLRFVKEQKYNEPEHDALRLAITLTGNMHDAVASTTESYLSRM